MKITTQQDIENHANSFNDKIANFIIELSEYNCKKDKGTLLKKENEEFIKKLEEFILVGRAFAKSMDSYKNDNASVEIKKFLLRLSNLGIPFYHTEDFSSLELLANNYGNADDGVLLQITQLGVSDNNYEVFINSANKIKGSIEGQYFFDAINCLIEKKYYSCVCSMFPLIENSLMKTQLFSSTENISHFKKAINSFFTTNKYPFYEDAWKNLDTLVHAIFLTHSDRNKSKKFKFINRNQLLHGDFSRKITAIDCIQLILLYMSVTECLPIMTLTHFINTIEKDKQNN